MNENLKSKLEVRIDCNIDRRAKLLLKAEKIATKIRFLQTARDRIYEKERQLGRKTDQLVEIYNADDMIAKFNEYKQQQLHKLHRQ